MRIARTVAGSALVFAAVFGVWQWVTASGLISPILLPSPLDTLRFLRDSFFDGMLTEAFLVTLRRLVVGYMMGLGLGVLMGLMLYRSPIARNTLGLAALGLQTLPSVCWSPLAILWFGQTEQAMYFVVIMGSVWAMSIAVENAIRAVPPQYVRAARVMGSRGAHTWRTVIFPAALPQLVAGAKLCWAFSWRSLMSAEIYITIIDRMGLGQLLHFGRELNAMDQVMGVMLVIIAVGLVIDRFAFVPLERRMRRLRGL
jgi:ABC-type nitrate/sulfonate/bicarbonate transport system, permease component